MHQALNPALIAPPLARYSHGIEVPAGHRLVLTSGQLGIAADGTVPASALEQARICFAACEAILGEAGLGPANAVRINAFVTAREHMAGYMQARNEWLDAIAHLPTSTLLIVAGFTRPEFLVEVEVTATGP